ncbi:MAG: hypothetical protein AAFX10_05695 [Pseudomonadota bacterium]
MSTEFSGIGPISPTYPVRPGQPINGDRQPGNRRKKKDKDDSPPESNDEPATGDGSNDVPTIDEHV